MSPILGIFASQNYPRITSSYESIATIIPSGSTNTVTFSSIPSTYKHLQLRLLQKDNYSANANASNFRLNSDSGSNYSYHRLIGNGSSASADGGGSQSATYIDYYASGNNSSYGGTIIDILDYTSTTKAKTIRSLTGYDANGNGTIALTSGGWYKNSSGVYEAVNTISFSIGGSGVYWDNKCSFALYGIKD